MRPFETHVHKHFQEHLKEIKLRALSNFSVFRGWNEAFR